MMRLRRGMTIPDRPAWDSAVMVFAISLAVVMLLAVGGAIESCAARLRAKDPDHARAACSEAVIDIKGVPDSVAACHPFAQTPWCRWEDVTGDGYLDSTSSAGVWINPGSSGGEWTCPTCRASVSSRRDRK